MKEIPITCIAFLFNQIIKFNILILQKYRFLELEQCKMIGFISWCKDHSNLNIKREKRWMSIEAVWEKKTSFCLESIS